MNDNVFVGTGKNPDPGGLDMPLGFGMALYQNTTALNCFGALSQDERNDIIKYIQSSTTGEDTKKRINDAVSNLNRSNPKFF